MMGRYPICENETIVGQAEVTQEGMILCIRCAVTSQAQAGRKLILVSGGRETELCRCSGEDLKLTKRIAVKRLDPEDLRFILKEERKHEDWIPVYEDQPFHQLSELENARFCTKDDQPGILLADN